MWKNLRFSGKVSLLVLVFLLFSLVIGLGYHTMSSKIRDIGIESSKDAMLNGYKGELKDIVDFTAQSLASATKGMTDKKAIYNTYSTYTKQSRFFPDKSGYMFIYENNTGFVHPIKAAIEGKNLKDLKDANGVLLIQELNKAAKSGGGFVNYLWDKPGKGNLPKISYATMIPGSGYWIGTGIYIDDVQAKEAEIKSVMNDFTQGFLIKLYAFLAAIFFLIIIPITLYMIKSMVAPLISLTKTAEDYSRGKIDDEFLDIDRKDEVGQMAASVKRLGRSTKIVMDRLQKMS